MIKKIRLSFAAIVAVLVAFMAGRCHKLEPVKDLLPSNVKEQLIIDPIKKSVVIITPLGKTVRKLPDSKTVVNVKTDGKIELRAPQFGWQMRPFTGVAVSDYGRVMLGLDIIYFKSYNLGLNFQSTLRNGDKRASLHVSRHVWSNVYAGLSIDNKKELGGLLYVRF